MKMEGCNSLMVCGSFIGGVKALTMPCAEEINFGFICTGSRPRRNMQKKPFIKMLSADKVDWHKPKPREKLRPVEVIKRIIVRKNPHGDQIATESPQRDVKDQ
jgi:hypothetical protein